MLNNGFPVPACHFQIRIPTQTLGFIQPTQRGGQKGDMNSQIERELPCTFKSFASSFLATWGVKMRDGSIHRLVSIRNTYSEKWHISSFSKSCFTYTCLMGYLKTTTGSKASTYLAFTYKTSKASPEESLSGLELDSMFINVSQTCWERENTSRTEQSFQ